MYDVFFFFSILAATAAGATAALGKFSISVLKPHRVILLSYAKKSLLVALSLNRSVIASFSLNKQAVGGG